MTAPRTEFTGHPCLIIGGTGGGIGSAVATAAGQAGAPIGIISRNRDSGDETIQQLQTQGITAALAVADVTNEAELVTAIAEITNTLGTIRHLVNVVGGAGPGAVQRTTDFEMNVLEGLLSRNLRYAIVACREIAKRLTAEQLPGTIVNISSGASKGVPFLGAYGAAKAALETYSRTMALEWAPRNIRVNVVSCGIIRTERNTAKDNPEKNKTIPLRRRGESTEVANAVMYLLSNQSSYTTGHTLNVDGGSHLGSPGGD